jgi:hypothetical protein
MAQRSAGYNSMLKTKWMTLAGASLAVLSSTALYITAFLWSVLGAPGNWWHASPYLNVWVFGMNLDSVLNDVGMLLVCGVLKKVDCSSLVSRVISTFGPSRNSVQAVLPKSVFDSQAYENDD